MTDSAKMMEKLRPVPVLYVAGPLSAKTSWVFESNVRAAEAVSLELALHGVPHICVHTMARFWDREIDGDVAMRMDLALIDRCDGIVLVRGWQHSRGTLAEITHCDRMGKLVYSSLRNVLDNIADIPGDLLAEGQVAPWSPST